MNYTFWHTVRYWVLLLLVLLIAFSCHPRIVELSNAAGMENGTILSRYIILVYAGLFGMCLNVKSMLKPKMVRVCWFMWGWIVIYYFITYAAFGKKGMMLDMRSIAICLVAIMIGWQLDLDKKKLWLLLIVFSSLILFVGLMQVLTNVGGFVIRDQYHTDNKNSLGVMLATGGVSFFVMALNNQSKRFYKIVLFGLALFSLVVLLTIRARAATLTSGIMLLYVLYERFKGKNFFFYLILGVIIAIIVFLVLPDSMKEYVFNSFFQNYEEDDITAGRAWRNRAALAFLSQNLLLGNIQGDTSIAQIHNYLLNRTFQFGILFVFPIVLMYFYVLINVIVKTIKSDNHNIYNLGYYLLLIPFIISMVEPSFPFGPGTATMINFLLFGVSLKNTSNDKTRVI